MTRAARFSARGGDGPARVLGYRREKSSGSVRRLPQGFFLTRTGSANLFTNRNLTVDHSHAKRRHSRRESFITRRRTPFPKSPAVKHVHLFWRVATFHRTDKHNCVIFEIFLREAFCGRNEAGNWGFFSYSNPSFRL